MKPLPVVQRIEKIHKLPNALIVQAWHPELDEVEGWVVDARDTLRIPALSRGTSLKYLWTITGPSWKELYGSYRRPIGPDEMTHPDGFFFRGAGWTPDPLSKTTGTPDDPRPRYGGSADMVAPIGQLPDGRIVAYDRAPGAVIALRGKRAAVAQPQIDECGSRFGAGVVAGGRVVAVYTECEKRTFLARWSEKLDSVERIATPIPLFPSLTASVDQQAILVSGFDAGAQRQRVFILRDGRLDEVRFPSGAGQQGRLAERGASGASGFWMRAARSGGSPNAPDAVYLIDGLALTARRVEVPAASNVVVDHSGAIWLARSSSDTVRRERPPRHDQLCRVEPGGSAAVDVTPATPAPIDYQIYPFVDGSAVVRAEQVLSVSEHESGHFFGWPSP